MQNYFLFISFFPGPAKLMNMKCTIFFFFFPPHPLNCTILILTAERISQRKGNGQVHSCYSHFGFLAEDSAFCLSFLLGLIHQWLCNCLVYNQTQETRTKKDLRLCSTALFTSLYKISSHYQKLRLGNEAYQTYLQLLASSPGYANQPCCLAQSPEGSWQRTSCLITLPNNLSIPACGLSFCIQRTTPRDD